MDLISSPKQRELHLVGCSSQSSRTDVVEHPSVLTEIEFKSNPDRVEMDVLFSIFPIHLANIASRQKNHEYRSSGCAMALSGCGSTRHLGRAATRRHGRPLRALSLLFVVFFIITCITESPSGFKAYRDHSAESAPYARPSARGAIRDRQQGVQRRQEGVEVRLPDLRAV